MGQIKMEMLSLKHAWEEAEEVNNRTTVDMTTVQVLNRVDKSCEVIAFAGDGVANSPGWVNGVIFSPWNEMHVAVHNRLARIFALINTDIETGDFWI